MTMYCFMCGGEMPDAPYNVCDDCMANRERISESVQQRHVDEVRVRRIVSGALEVEVTVGDCDTCYLRDTESDTEELCRLCRLSNEHSRLVSY